MSQQPLCGGTEDRTVTAAPVTSTQRGRPKTESVSASGTDRPTVATEGSASDMQTGGKRFSVYPMQRRGSRKKTLSLNPEEREALENLIEEVIMDGVGEGVIDSDASLSDDDQDTEDEHSPSVADGSLPGSSTAVTVGDLSKQNTFVKGGKKFYPGQLKVALKHMHDLPPRFVRKLAKAQQYLDAGGSMHSKPVVSVGPIEEEEEMTTHSKDDSQQSKLTAVVATSASSVPERDRDKTRLKESKLKDAKKVIRTLLTDREQYVDETVVSSRSETASTDGVFSTASDTKPQSIAQYHQHGATAQHIVSNKSVSVSENAGALSSAVVCSSELHIYHPCVAGNTSTKVAKHIHETSDINYKTGQSSYLGTSGSLPIPTQPFQSPSVGISQYQLSVPVVHGMKPAPVLSQSPPGTQFWIPEAVVPSNAPGFYGSSPPVVGVTGVPAAFNQPVPYAYSIQSSYPAVHGPPASYTPQYVYSAVPPSQGLVGQAYSTAAGFNQPLQYPLTVLHPEQYARPPSAVSPNFYQNVPPPGYCHAQSLPASDQRRMFAGNDGTRKQIVSADHSHGISALSAAAYQPLTQPVKSSIHASTGHRNPDCTVSAHRHETYQKSCPVIHSSSHNSQDASAKMMYHTQRYSPDPLSATSSHRPGFSKSPVCVPLPSACSINTSISNPDPHSVQSSSVAAKSHSPGSVQPDVSAVCTIESTMVDKTILSPVVESSETGNADAKRSEPQHTSPSDFPSHISDAGVLSSSVSVESVDHSDTGDSDTAVCSEVLEPCSSLMKQESDARNVVEPQPDYPCVSTDSLTQPASDLDVSGTAVLPSVHANSGELDVVSYHAKDVIQVTSSVCAGDHSGETMTSSVVTDTESVKDQLACELQSGLNSTSEPETLNRSLSDPSQQHVTYHCVSGRELSSTVSAEVADISTAAGAVKSGSSSELVITLSSSLISALTGLFGLPPAYEADHGKPVVFQVLSAQYDESFCLAVVETIIL